MARLPLRFTSIRVTIAVWTGVALLLLAGALVGYSAFTLNEKETKLVENEAQRIASTAATQIEQRLRHGLIATQTLAEALASARESGQALSREAVSAMLRRAIIDNPEFINSYTSWAPGAFDDRIDPRYGDWYWDWWTRQGDTISQVVDNTDFATDSTYDYYACPATTGKSCVVEPYLYEDASKAQYWLATISSPVVVDGTVVGIVCFDLKVDLFQDIVDSTKAFDGAGTLAVISGQGNLLGVTGHPELFGQPLKDIHPATFEDDVKVVQSGAATITRNGETVSIFVPITIEDAHWSLALDVPTATINESVTASTLGMILIGGVLALVALVLMVFLTGKAVADPIVVLSRAAQQIAGGDLNVSVHVNSGDELGQMAQAFNRMTAYLREMAEAAERISQGDLTHDIQAQNPTDQLGTSFERMLKNLRDLVGALARTARSLGGSASDLNESAKQAAHATNQITTTIQYVSKGIGQQTASVTQTAASVEQMGQVIGSVTAGARQQLDVAQQASRRSTDITTAIQHVADNAINSASLAGEAAKSARAGSLIIEETIAGMGAIKTAVGQASDKVHAMGHQSDQIAHIVDTIDDIASQTNLLALNAAIEAARAGQQGKGFAVVADEVRKLAERSATATKEIGLLIKDIQVAIKAAIDAMSVGSNEVESGAQRASQSGVALSSILESTESVSLQINAIALSAREISSTSGGLIKDMDDLVAVADENTAATQVMTQSSQSVSQAVETIASVSEENNAAVEEVSASTEEVNAQVAGVTQAAGTLTGMADSLQAIVARFTLPEQSPTAFGQAFTTPTATVPVKAVVQAKTR